MTPLHTVFYCFASQASPTMSQSESYATQPPSYEEAVYGVPPPEASNSSLPVTNTPVHTPQPTYHSSSHPPTVHYSNQQHSTPPPPPQRHIPYPYNVCPPGAEPLLNIHEILVYSSKGKNTLLFTIIQRSSLKIHLILLRCIVLCMQCTIK